MKTLKLFAALMTAAVVAGCASVDTPSRNAAFAQQGTAESFAQSDPSLRQTAPDYRLARINVTAPRTLVVSEANSYKPRGDVVWRGDAAGDRLAQVEKIFEDAMTRGAQSVRGSIPVIVDIEITRFHALTEKTRSSIGGVHEIEFMLSIRSAETGLMLRAPRHVQADIVAVGGQEAVEADLRGQTQKVVISAHLENIIRTELSTAEGYQNVRLGLFR